VAVSEAAARAFCEAIGNDDGIGDARQCKSRDRSHSERPAFQHQADQGEPALSPELQNHPTRIISIDGHYLVDSESVVQIKVQKRIDNGVEEIRFYEKYRASLYGLRHVPRNDYTNRGYWYPDSQQFYLQGCFSHGSCGGDWSEIIHLDFLNSKLTAKYLRPGTPAFFP